MPPARGITSPTPVPRVIAPSERAPEGLKRYKLHADLVGVGVGGRHSSKYVLAESEEQAKECYLEVSGIRRMLEGMTAKGEKSPPVAFTVTELPD